MTSPSAVRGLRLIPDRCYDLNSELLEDLGRHRGRRAGQRIAPARDLREGDHLAEVRLAGHACDEAVDAHREAAVRRRAHLQRLEQEAELRLLLVRRDPHRPEDRLLELGVVDPDRAGAELPAVPDQVVVLAERGARVGLDLVLVTGHGRGERMMEERPVAGVLVPLEEREVDHPVEDLAPVSARSSSRPRCVRRPPSTRATSASSPRRRAPSCRARRRTRPARLRRGTSRSASGSRPTRRTRGTRAPSPPTPSRSPRAARAPRARTPAARRGTARPGRRRRRRTASPRVISVASWISSAEAEVGLVGAVARHRLGVGQARERPGGRLALDRLERRDDCALHHVEHVLAVDERHLEVELAELELPVGAEILVAPAGRDLVVAVEAADHAQLLEELRRLREREEAARLQAHRHEEVARALGRPLRHARRPDVDEVERVHLPANRVDHRVVEAQVALHPFAAHVELAVAESQHLVDVLLVDLERQRLRARDDRQLVDLDLDRRRSAGSG